MQQDPTRGMNAYSYRDDNNAGLEATMKTRKTEMGEKGKLELTTKPDINRVIAMWEHYWNGEMLGRPIVVAQVPQAGKARVNPFIGCYANAISGDYRVQLDLLDRWLEDTIFMGEAIPFFSPDHGPDQFAAFLGAELKFSPENRSTCWCEPCVEDWESFLPMKLNENNPTWQSILHYSQVLSEHGRGRYLVGMADLHSQADALSALRHPDKLCLDLYDCPQTINQALEQASKLYPIIYDALFKAGNMGKTGSIGWAPFWSPQKFATLQSDFSFMISTEMFRKFTLPALIEEAQFVDHCVYHMDGVNQINHADDILAIKEIDVIQWVPGAGQEEMFSRKWRDILKKFQKAGKGLWIYGEYGLDVVKDIYSDLNPQGLVFEINGSTQQEVESIINWLEKNS